MGTRKVVMSLLVLGLLSIVGVGMALAADAPAAGAPAAGGNGGRGGRGNFDPAAMRQRMLDRVKEQLQATDDEWKVLQPRIEKVMTLQRDTRSRGMMGGRRGGRPGGATTTTAAADQSPVAKATEALQKVLDNKDATADQVKAALTALREAREKAKQEMDKAQESLRELVTPRQEAQLVLLGMLE